MKKLIVLFLILIGSTSISTGQNLGAIVSSLKSNGEEALQTAGELYNNGDYDGCISLLDSVSKNAWLTKKGRENIYTLKSKALLEKDEISQAEDVVYKILKKNPNYELIEENNNEDFNRLVKRFYVTPKFSLGVKNAVMNFNFTSTKTYSILEKVDYNVPYLKYGNGWYTNYYGWMEIQPFKSISFNFDLIYYTIGYYRVLTSNTRDWNLYYSENLTFLEIPTYVKKSFNVKNFLFNINGGIGYLYLTNSKANVSLTYTEGAVDKSIYHNEIDITSLRKKNNFEWLAGGSIGYKIRNIRIYLDVRYFGGFANAVNPSQRNSNTELINEYSYVDNDFKYNKALEIGASISYIFKHSVKKVPLK